MTLSVSNHEIHVNTIKFTNHFVLIQASYKTKNIQIVVSLIFQKFQLRSSDGWKGFSMEVQSYKDNFQWDLDRHNDYVLLL